MSESFEEKVAYWKQMPHGTIDEKSFSELYYDIELMPFITESFENRSHQFYDLGDKGVTHMILSVGTSYQPLVLSLSYFKPTKVLFLHTDESEKEIDKILEFVKMEPSNYKKSMIDKSNTLQVYNEIKKAYVEWGKPKDLVIDFTGGTKAMSAAAAMAGSVIEVYLIYVDNKKYLPDLRRPEPCSEFLQEIPNPYKVFGDLEFEKAIELFGEFDYANAHRILYKISNLTPNPEGGSVFEVLSKLALCYREWDRLHFMNALEKMDEVCSDIKKYSSFNSNFILKDKYELLKSQHLVLKELSINKEMFENRNIPLETFDGLERFIPILFTVYSNAKRRKSQKKYDMAALLMYRLLEMIMQRRMMKNGIYVFEANYSKCKEDFKYAVKTLKSNVYESQCKNDGLPKKILLMEGYIQLAVLEDDLLKGKDKENYLRHIKEKVDIRNLSIFAHGFKTISRDEYEEFEKIVEELFLRFCEIEDINFERQVNIHTFINPKDSIYFKN